MPPSHIGVIGGGISGLSSAFHLSRRFPKTRITLFESQPSLGGWIRSKRLNLPQDSGSVVVEAGPHTLRPVAKSLLELVHILRLEDQVITVPKFSAAAMVRYMYVPPPSAVSPDLIGLQAVPSTLSSVWNSPLTPMLLFAMAEEYFKGPNRQEGVTDESVDSFLTRRFGENIAQTFGSAIIHGIYAADSRNLSVRAVMPTLWELEERGKGSVVAGFFNRERKQNMRRDYELGDLQKKMRDVSVYSFKDGMETLARALGGYLFSCPNVEVKLNTSVSQLLVKDGGFKISTLGGEAFEPSHVVSCIPPHALSNILSSDTTALSIPHINDKRLTSSVQVINLVFPVPPSEIHPEGFGYLIPRPLKGYPTSVHETSGILGTIFDSCSLSQQDTPWTEDYYTEGNVTKVTIMTGGPYPLPPLPSTASDTTFDEFIKPLLTHLEIHLGKELPMPLYWSIQENKDCIPTPQPGHLDRVAEMRKALLETPGLEGRLEIIGAHVDGVSVGDCAEAGKRAGASWGPQSSEPIPDETQREDVEPEVPPPSQQHPEDNSKSENKGIGIIGYIFLGVIAYDTVALIFGPKKTKPGPKPDSKPDGNTESIDI